MVTICLTSAGYMINSAFTEWSDNPVITTLETISAPIDDIQFPTVTVCPDTKEPPDSWAFLENILDFLAFDCRPSVENCSNTEPLRRDFEFLIKNVKGIHYVLSLCGFELCGSPFMRY